jgi:voltage-gated potassium channel
MLRNRAQYTGVITILLTFLVLMTASILVVQFESGSVEANITSGFDGLWWTAVTITTVGYGDHYPVTFGGRLTAVFVMLMGIGIIGVLASILSNFLAGNSGEQGDSDFNPNRMGIQDELGDIKHELAALRQLVYTIDERMDEEKGD